VTPQTPNCARKHWASRPVSVIVHAILVILLILAEIILAINIFVRVAYSSFFDQAQNEFATPGINTGFVPQDLAYLEDDDIWLFSGYMGDGSASPLWRRTSDGGTSRVYLQWQNGSDYKGHGSAVTSYDNYVFVACDAGYLVFDKQALVDAADGEHVAAIDRVTLGLSPAFMNIAGGYMYAGEFYHPTDYPTDETHHYTVSGTTENMAIMYALPLSETAKYGVSDAPAAVYSIPALVQGCTIANNGNIVLSRSYGLATSFLVEYDINTLVDCGYFTTAKGVAPLYGFDEASIVRELAAPPMTEGIATVGDRIYIADEAACNKYIFGKLYGAWEVYSINW
jgi:hypothetical protein